MRCEYYINLRIYTPSFSFFCQIIHPKPPITEAICTNFSNSVRQEGMEKMNLPLCKIIGSGSDLPY